MHESLPAPLHLTWGDVCISLAVTCAAPTERVRAQEGMRVLVHCMTGISR